ncbi:unnamed protein product [Caenorhabditis sp. 36 PRJEB53466]|nr:unnamed protein product [Caenorhabditis sp. 36 PRJEB53466]
MAIVTALSSSFSFGFQLLITNPAQDAFIHFLNASKSFHGTPDFETAALENEWSIIVAVLFLGSASGAFLIRTKAEKFGRKLGIMIAISIQIFSSILSILSFWMVCHTLFTFARFLMGVGITTSMGLSAMFVTESSPNYCRGKVSMINGVFLQFSLSLAGLAVVNSVIVTIMYAHSYTQNVVISYFLIPFICLFNFLFAMGPGPLSMFLSGELVPQTCRSASSVWTNASMSAVRFLILISYIPLKNETAEHTAYAVFFIIPLIVAVAILYTEMPETKGKHIENTLQNSEQNIFITW